MSGKETHSHPMGTGSRSGSREEIPQQQTRTKSRRVRTVAVMAGEGLSRLPATQCLEQRLGRPWGTGD